MDGILRKMLDKNKKVQEVGALAFANLEEKAGKKLEPYCGPIFNNSSSARTLSRCLDSELGPKTAFGISSAKLGGCLDFESAALKL
ncbi:hypothetical protein ACHAQJ_006476 [Trichoderma viride]